MRHAGRRWLTAALSVVVLLALLSELAPAFRDARASAEPELSAPALTEPSETAEPETEPALDETEPEIELDEPDPAPDVPALDDADELIADEADAAGETGAAEPEADEGTMFTAEFADGGDAYAVTETEQAHLAQTGAAQSGALREENALTSEGESLLANLSVAVTALCVGDPGGAAETSFAFTVTKNGAPYVGTYSIGETTGTTDDTGGFALQSGQTAVFESFGAAGEDTYSVTQTGAAGYTPRQPSDGAYSGTLALDTGTLAFLDIGGMEDAVVLRRRWELSDLARTWAGANGLPAAGLTVTAGSEVTGVVELSGAAAQSVDWSAGGNALDPDATYLIPPAALDGGLTVAQTLDKTYWLDGLARHADYDEGTDTLRLYDTYVYYEAALAGPLTITGSTELVNTLTGYDSRTPDGAAAVVVKNDWTIRSEGDALGQTALEAIYATYYASCQLAASASSWNDGAALRVWSCDSGTGAWTEADATVGACFAAARDDGYEAEGCRFADADRLYLLPRESLPDGFAVTAAGLDAYSRTLSYDGAERFARVTRLDGEGDDFTLVSQLTVSTPPTAPLRVEKMLSDGAQTQTRFSFQLTRVLSLDEEGVPLDTEPAAGLAYEVRSLDPDAILYTGRTDGEGTFSLPAGAYARFVLPVGAWYAVTERRSIEYTLESVTADGTEQTGQTALVKVKDAGEEGP